MKIITLTLIGLSCFLQAKEINTFTSIEPIEFLVEQITQNESNHSALIAKGQEPHSFTPIPSQLIALSKSDIYFSIDLKFEQQLFKKIKKLNNKIKIIDIDNGIKRLSMKGKEESHKHDHNCSHTNLDPHIWLSPKNLIILSENITKALSEIDVANSAIYQKNLKTLISKLKELDIVVSDILKKQKDKTILVFHPSFGYFMHSYDLKQMAVEINGNSPSPKQLQKLINTCKEYKIKTVFAQPQFDAKSAKIIAKNINGKVEFINPLEKNIISNIAYIAKIISN